MPYKLRNWAVTSTCLVSLLLILYGIGIGETLDKEGKMNSQALWRYMTVENPYQNYPTWPGKEGFYESTMPPGNILKLYVNAIALETIVKKKGIFSDGALLIKENYTDDRKLFFNHVQCINQRIQSRWTRLVLGKVQTGWGSTPGRQGRCVY